MAESIHFTPIIVMDGEYKQNPESTQLYPFMKLSTVYYLQQTVNWIRDLTMSYWIPECPLRTVCREHLTTLSSRVSEVTFFVYYCNLYTRGKLLPSVLSDDSRESK